MGKNNVTIKVINSEKYLEVYEKIWAILKDYDTSKKLTLDVSFVSDEYVSFLYKSEGKCIALNYSFDSGFFERESVVLRYAGINKKKISKILKNNSIKPIKLFSRVFLFSGGIGIICDNRGERVIKIRL